MKKDINFLVVGVGGQGTILSSDILAEVGMEAGYDVKKSNVLGLAIRGGSVTSHVRWGEKVGSPMSMKGDVDYIISSEPMEALRSVDFLKPDSTIIYNSYKLQPMLVSTGKAEYPSDDTISFELHAAASKVYSVNATDMATDMGNAKITNIILLGVVSQFLGIDKEIWEKVIRRFVPAKFTDLNINAFLKGAEEKL